MRRSRETLLRELVDDFRPVRRLRSPAGAAAAWLAGAWTFVAAVTLAAGPMRPGFAGQLLDSPRFLGESLLGVLVGAAAALALTRLRIPGAGSPLREVAPALGLFAGWLALYVYGLADPALQPSMLGKRDLCVLETALYAMLPLAAGLRLAGRAAPLARGWTGALAGLAAAAVPAQMMQLACMYDPAHILSFHLAPVLGVGALGAFLGRRLLRPL